MFPVNAFGMFINYAFVAVPLFVYMGTLMEDAGVAEKLYGAFYQLLGPVRAGLSLATIAMATVFGACTGIVGAGVILIGLLALPSMLSRGYNVSLANRKRHDRRGLGGDDPSQSHVDLIWLLLRGLHLRALPWIHYSRGTSWHHVHGRCLIFGPCLTRL